MDKNTGESAGAGAQAAAGSGYLWLGGVAAGLAAGAVLWFVALGPMDQPVTEAPKDAAATPVAAVAPAAPATTVTSAAPAAEPAVAEPAVAEPAASTEVAATTTEPAPNTEPAPAVAMTFDTVRAEADGTVLVAGRAAPGAEVAVMADGAEVGRATADSAGQFVTFLSMGSSSGARVLTLSTMAADGAVTVGDASVILSPTPELKVAAAETAAEPATEPATVAAEAVPAAPTEPAATEPAATEPATTEPATTEPATPQVLIADSKGVRKLGAGAATSIVIDTIAYSAAGDVQLAGRAEGGGTARIYLDNAQAGEGPIDDGGAWAVTLPGIAAGRYTLRVDQVGADGKVASRFETPFQREAPEVVAAATQAQPATTATATEAVPDTTTADVAPIVTETATPTVTPEPATVAPVATEAAPVAKPADAADLPPITTATVVTVQPGFTLWQIARENYGDGMLYVKVFQANKNLIRNPDLIYPGQLFTVPKGN